MDRTHMKIMTQTHGLDVRGGGAKTYVVSFPCVLTSVACPVKGAQKGHTNQEGSVNTSCTGNGRPR